MIRYIMAPAPEITSFHPESQKLVWMSPEKYLNLLNITERYEMGWTEDEQVVIVKLMKRMQKGLEIDPLFLDIDIETGRVISQEGRHRASAAKKVGISEIPVILYAVQPRRFTGTSWGWEYTSADKIPVDIGEKRTIQRQPLFRRPGPVRVRGHRRRA